MKKENLLTVIYVFYFFIAIMTINRFITKPNFSFLVSRDMFFVIVMMISLPFLVYNKVKWTKYERKLKKECKNDDD